MRNKKQIQSSQTGDGSASARQPHRDGFTLIELLVVIAIIALLSSIALIALMSARQKSRDAKRLTDMTQMNTGLELYFAYNKGYPSLTSNLSPNFVTSIPSSPLPADGGCSSLTYPSPVPAGTYANNYYYYPSGTSFIGADGTTLVYPDFAYYFCLGNQTGNFRPGLHIITPSGVK
jgi:general secretion pathway protein G